MMSQLMMGAIAMACFVVGLFFLRFWRQTRDRFFLFFCISFWVDGINRLSYGLNMTADEHEPILYLVRFLAFLLILVAIVDKNRKRNDPVPTDAIGNDRT